MLPKTWNLPCSEHGGSNSKRHFNSSTVNIHIVPGDFIETVHFFHQENATSDKVQRVQYHLELRSKRYKFMYPVLFQFTTWMNHTIQEFRKLKNKDKGEKIFKKNFLTAP